MSNNPVKDFTDAVEAASPKTKQYFDLFYRRSYKFLNGPWYKRLFKKIIRPLPQFVQDAEKQIIMVYLWNEKKGILAPPLRIKYSRSPEGSIQLDYKLETKAFVK